MRGISNRDGRTFFNPWLEDQANGAGVFARYDLRAAPHARAADGLTATGGILATPQTGAADRPDNYQPVESAWYIPGPAALIDVYTPNENTTGTLVVDDVNHVIAACDTPGDLSLIHI